MHDTAKNEKYPDEKYKNKERRNSFPEEEDEEVFIPELVRGERDFEDLDVHKKPELTCISEDGIADMELPENLLDYKVNGFCSSLYEDAINSILRNMNNDEGSTLVIYSDQYQDIAQNIISYSTQIWAIPYTASNFQDYAAEILGVRSSNKRFEKISSLNPNQKLQFKTWNNSIWFGNQNTLHCYFTRLKLRKMGPF